MRTFRRLERTLPTLIWTKTADEILPHATRNEIQTHDTSHPRERLRLVAPAHRRLLPDS
jgi:hypothetical protein